MNQSKIEEFGRLLVQLVRDVTVKSCDQNLQTHASSPVAKRWREVNGGFGAIIPDCVDETIFQFLRAVDEGGFQVSFRSGSGELIDLNAEGMGELAGMYMASGGWRSDYSSERYNDDFADLG